MSLIFQVEKKLKISINLQSSSADIPKRAKYTPSLFLKKSTIIQKQNQEKKNMTGCKLDTKSDRWGKLSKRIGLIQTPHVPFTAREIWVGL